MSQIHENFHKGSLGRLRLPWNRSISITKRSNGAGNDIVPIVKDLAAAFELNSRSSNRIWITLAILSVLTVSPQYIVGPHPALTSLPFSLGSIPTSYHIPFMLVVLSLTAIHYSQTQAQAFFIYMEAHKQIDKMGEDSYASRHHFDLLLFPTLSRTSPLVRLGRQTLLRDGHWQFGEKLYYGFIRVLTSLVLIGMPCAAISLSFYNIMSPFWGANILGWLARFCSLLAIVSLLQLLAEDLRHWLTLEKKGAFDK